MNHLLTLFDLTGKTALVTGASSGLGERFARCLSQAGARVIMAARNLEKLEILVQEIENAVPLQLDIANKNSVQQAFEALEEREERLDICINAAGIYQPTPVFEEDLEGDFESLFETNAFGTWRMIQHVATHMRQHGITGSIINISSVNGAHCLQPERANYCASKAAIIQMTKALVGELGDVGIRINCIVPGLFQTPATEYKLQTEEQRAEIKRLIPLHFIGQPSDLDGTILYLASNKASPYLTGSVITVDGGISWGGVR
ncbi:MAG: SDR family NAD(P)-dependent oxidoreductase [Chthoniobacterales bacterium]